MADQFLSQQIQQRASNAGRLQDLISSNKNRFESDWKEMANQQFNEGISKYSAKLQTAVAKDIASESWKRHGAIIVTKDINEAIQISNQLAPEHLELSFQNAKEYLNDIKHAGAIFVGTSTTYK